MTGKSCLTMETHRIRSELHLRAVASVVILILSCAALQAQETDVTQSYVTDSSNDRTPSITAFPSYPHIARRDRIEGEAVVCFRIATDGRIHSIRVKSYSKRIFRRPAIRAIKDSSFEALRLHERYSSERTCRTYRFRLEPAEPGAPE
jgi:TonB family protein